MSEPTARRKWLRRHSWGIAFGILVIAVAVLTLPRLLFGPVIPVVAVVQRDFVQSVVASGRVQTPHRVEIGAQTRKPFKLSGSAVLSRSGLTP